MRTTLADVSFLRVFRGSAVFTFFRFKMRLADEQGNSAGQVIDETDCLKAAIHNLVLTELCKQCACRIKVPIPRFGLLGTLLPASDCVPLAFIDRAYAPSANKVVCKTDRGLVIVCRDDLRRRLDDCLQQFEDLGPSLFVLVQSLQDRPEVR